MSTVRRVTQNSVFLLIGDGTVRLLGILLTVYLARELGATDYGKYAFALSFSALFLVISDMGLGVLTIREITRDHNKAESYPTTILFSKLILSLIMLGIIVAAINLLGYTGDTVIIVYIVGSTNIFSSFATYFRAIFRAFEKMEYDAMTSIGERIIVIVPALFLLLQGRGLVAVVTAMLIAQTLGTLVTAVVCIRKFTRLHLAFDFTLAWSLFKTALPISLTSILDSIMFQTDMVILSKMKGNTVVGWYAAAYRPAFAMLFLPTIFAGAIFPVISRYFISDRHGLTTAYEKSLKLLFILAIPLGIGTTLLAPRIISLLYTIEYASSIIDLQILIWAVSLIFLNTFFVHTLIAINQQKMTTVFSGICALLNLVLNLILIPSFSHVGAASTTVASQVLVFVLEFSYLQKILVSVNLLKVMLKPLVASLLMGAVVFTLDSFLGSTVTNVFVIVLAAIVIYCLVLYLTKTLDRQEVDLLKGVFKRKITRS